MADSPSARCTAIVSGRLPARTNVDDLGDERVIAHRRRHLIEPLAKRAGTEEHRLIGARSA